MPKVPLPLCDIRESQFLEHHKPGHFFLYWYAFTVGNGFVCAMHALARISQSASQSASQSVSQSVSQPINQSLVTSSAAASASPFCRSASALKPRAAFITRACVRRKSTVGPALASRHQRCKRNAAVTLATASAAATGPACSPRFAAILIT